MINILLFFNCCFLNTIHFNENGLIKNIELVLKNQYKITRVDFLRKENTNPFFIKNIEVPKQKYFTSYSDIIREIDVKKANFYDNLNTVINLEFDLGDLKALTNCFFFFICEDGRSFNLGFFEIEENHNLKITEGPFFIATDELITLEVVKSKIKLDNDDVDDERKHWSKKEIIMFICSGFICGVAICGLCYWFSKRMAKANVENII